MKTVALIRFRFRRPGARAYRVPMNVTVGGREWPVGLILVAAILALPALSLLVIFDAPSLAGAALLVAHDRASRRCPSAPPRRIRMRRTRALDDFQLLPSGDADLTHVEARPGNVLVPVRKPGALTHLTAALRAAGDRDVVAMTVRLVGVDVPDDPSAVPRTTDDERRLLSAVVALAEREARPGAAADCARRQRVRLGRRDGAAARIGGDSRRRIGNAVGRRSGAAARRGVGTCARRARRRRPARRSSSARRHRRVPPRRARARPSSPRTSISFTGSGSTPPGPSARTCIIAMSCAPH